MTNITFKIITHGGPDYKAAVTLREEILRKPLGLTFLSEELAFEKEQIHIAGFSEGEVCATAVLVPEGRICKMQRVAVKEGAQGKGIGSMMMKFCEEQAKAKGFQEIYCHARYTALPFYLKHHYVAEGETFDEDGIPHRRMRKAIR